MSEITPRLLTREEAAAYCRVLPDTFDEYRRRGIVPGPLPGTKRWDRHAIDAKLDALSGLKTNSSALERWRAERNARAT